MSAPEQQACPTAPAGWTHRRAGGACLYCGVALDPIIESYPCTQYPAIEWCRHPGCAPTNESSRKEP